MSSINLRFLYAMEVLSGLSRGSFLVCIGWTTLIVSGDVARVGQVFVVGMLTNILVGPLLGALVDRYNRKSLVLVAHLGIGLVMVVAGLVLGFGEPRTSLVFFATTVSVYIFRLLYQLAHDGLIRGNVPVEALVVTIARARFFHLMATAVGTVVAGIALERFGAFAGFGFSALMSLLLLVPVAFVKGAKALGGASGLVGFFGDLVAGLGIIIRNPGVRMMAILAAVTLPVGQLSNAILSSFVHNDLAMGGDVFGLVDSAWPIGGMAAAGIMNLGLGLLSRGYVMFVFSICAGLATVVFSFCTTVPTLVVVHCAMGFFVWMCHILIDARVLQECGVENVGRAKAGVQVMFSISAAIMCLSPSFVALPLTSGYFLFWGGIATIGSIAVGVVFVFRQR